MTFPALCDKINPKAEKTLSDNRKNGRLDMKDFLKPYGAVPNAVQMAHLKMEKKAFFHFGINTFTNAEWGDGTETERDFNPVGCDPRQWVRAIKAAGFTLALITAKHHDGFCLWQSDVTEHSMKNSPYKDGKGDVVKEFADACREYGIKVGIYASPWDRNAPFWGTDKYSPFFARQLEELMTRYGKIDEVWWDGAGSRDTPYDWEMWASVVKKNQPEAAIFGSQGATPYVDLRWVGNEGGFAGSPCFATIDPHALEVEHTPTLNSGTPDGERFIPAEVDVSIRPGWFFHEEQEDEVKSVASLVRLWFDSVGSNANMLLNFPPDKTGHIRDKDTRHAIEAHKIVSAALAVNHALGAKIVSDADCQDGYPAENLITPGDNFTAPKKTNVSYTITLPEKKRINMFVIEEAIEYGHRVRGFKVEALADGEWKTLFDGKCIGYKWSEMTEEVTTDTVRVTVTDSKDVPLLRSFGLHTLDLSVFDEEKRLRSGKNLAAGKSAKISYSEFEVEVEFGGVYPFNTVAFNSNGMWKYEIWAFDGSNYQLIYTGVKPHRNQITKLKETVRTSYKMKLVTTAPIDPETINICVMEN